MIKSNCLFDNIAMSLSNIINDNIIKVRALNGALCLVSVWATVRYYSVTSHADANKSLISPWQHNGALRLVSVWATATTLSADVVLKCVLLSAAFGACFYYDAGHNNVSQSTHRK